MIYLRRKTIRQAVKSNTLNKEVNAIIVNHYLPFIDDFYTLAMNNGWTWGGESIEVEDIVAELHRTIYDILAVKEMVSVETGRLRVTKRKEDKDYCLSICISY